MNVVEPNRVYLPYETRTGMKLYVAANKFGHTGFINQEPVHLSDFLANPNYAILKIYFYPEIDSFHIWYQVK